jgi:shikimate dehydrogenase
MREITGKTKLFAIVADPITQVKTPQAINAHMEKHDFDGVLVPMQVSPAELPTLMAGLKQTKNMMGIVVTVPHKTAIVNLCDEVTLAAKQVGAVNVIRREESGKLIGDILDGKGFVAGLKTNGIDPKGLKAYLAGSGGAANAIAFSLAEAGVAQLTIANRTRSKAEDLAERVAKNYPNVKVLVGTASPVGQDLIVNGTSLGMASGDAYPLNVEELQAHQTVAEIIMTPTMTPLLEAAKAKGCKIHFGLPMLQCQIELMAQFMGITKNSSAS